MREASGNALVVYGGLAIVLAIVLLVFSIPFSFSDNEDISMYSGVARWWALRLGAGGASMLVGGLALLISAGNPGRRKKPKLPEYRRCSNCAVENFLWREHCDICGKPLEWP